MCAYMYSDRTPESCWQHVMGRWVASGMCVWALQIPWRQRPYPFTTEWHNWFYKDNYCNKLEPCIHFLHAAPTTGCCSSCNEENVVPYSLSTSHMLEHAPYMTNTNTSQLLASLQKVQNSKECCWFKWVSYRQIVRLAWMQHTSDISQVAAKPWRLEACSHIFSGKWCSKPNNASSLWVDASACLMAQPVALHMVMP